LSKAILISIRPEWCELIASGEKTIEVRKTAPKIETPFKCYIYCTKPKFEHEDYIVFNAGTENARGFYCGGKVIGEFVCDAVFPISFYASDASFFDTEPPLPVPGTRLTDKEIADYLGNGKTGWGWLISDLKIYDEPKPLTAFQVECPRVYCVETCKHYRKDCNPFGFRPITRAPQSWMFIED